MSAEQRIQQYIEQLFSDASKDSRITEVKNEILLNTQDRYHDLIAEGKNEEEAYHVAISTVGDIQELLDSMEDQSSPPLLEHEKKKKAKGKGRIKCIQDEIEHILWMLMLTLYFVISFATGAWYITWLIFLITPALNNIQRAIFDLCRGDKADPPFQMNSSVKKTYRSITSAMWILMTVLFFVVSFWCSAWYLTWTIFLLASAVNSIIRLFPLITSSAAVEETSQNL